AKAAGKKTNYIEPAAVIAKSGTEMFRLWAGSTEFRNDISYSQAILDGLAEWYRKLRNTAKYLLGNLADFDPDRHGRAHVSLAIDRYMLGRLDEVIRDVRAAYDKYEFHVVHRLLVEFVTVDLSAVYGDVTKDRLYSDAVDAPARRAAQVVQYECLRALATLAAPVLAFTAEDIWAHLPRRADDPASVHVALFPTATASATGPDLALAADFKVVLDWRVRVNKALEPFRAQKRKSADAAVVINPTDADRVILTRYADELADLFIVSKVSFGVGSDEVTVTHHTGAKCERCWKHFDQLAADPADVCQRCADALAQRKAP
ncbi:MAG: class I tRNA ligase family protein, partial [Proteobacteria bacterium]|nr:class I tRNA ligase family protein [Pseudomonadota bacterium]